MTERPEVKDRRRIGHLDQKLEEPEGTAHEKKTGELSRELTAHEPVQRQTAAVKNQVWHLEADLGRAQERGHSLLGKGPSQDIGQEHYSSLPKLPYVLSHPEQKEEMLRSGRRLQEQCFGWPEKQCRWPSLPNACCSPALRGYAKGRSQLRP